MEKIRLALKAGPLLVDAHVRGNFAIHRVFAASSSWRASHIPTGMSMGSWFASYRQTCRYVRELRAMDSWDYGTFGDKGDMPDALRRAAWDVYCRIRDENR